jgi:hypothetical protein
MNLHRNHKGTWPGLKGHRTYCRFYTERRAYGPLCQGEQCTYGPDIPACPDLALCLQNDPDTGKAEEREDWKKSASGCRSTLPRGG